MVITGPEATLGRLLADFHALYHKRVIERCGICFLLDSRQITLKDDIVILTAPGPMLDSYKPKL